MLFSSMIGGQIKFNKIFHFSICNTMKTVNYKGASNRHASIIDLCTSQLYCSPSDLPY